MPHWPERDPELRALQAQGLTWAQTAERMQLSLYAVKSYGLRIGLTNAHLQNGGPRPADAPTKRRPVDFDIAPRQIVGAGKRTLPVLPSLVGFFDD